MLTEEREVFDGGRGKWRQMDVRSKQKRNGTKTEDFGIYSLEAAACVRVCVVRIVRIIHLTVQDKWITS